MVKEEVLRSNWFMIPTFYDSILFYVLWPPVFIFYFSLQTF